MTLEDLDRLLISWKARTDAAAAGLVELRSLPSYEILSGGHDGKKLQLTGPSEERGTPALGELDQAWRSYGALNTVYQRAVSLRRQMPRFSGVQQRIDETLSVVSQLEPLCARMTRSFESGKAGLLEIDAAWKAIDEKIDGIALFLNARRGESAAGIPQLRALIESVRSRIMSDPIGVRAIFESQIEPVFQRVRAAMERLEEQRRNLGGDLVRAKSMLLTLSLVREQNQAAFEERRDKISSRGTPELPLASERMKELENRLRRMEEDSASGRIDPVCVELEYWTGEMRHLTNEEQKALDKNRALLDLRRELRGRLSALKAKATAQGVAEDIKLGPIGQKAEGLLYAKQTPIEEAAWLVSQYEARLNGRA
jgi:predicted  nucleic acid-binding Zn-ribbon protein